MYCDYLEHLNLICMIKLIVDTISEASIGANSEFMEYAIAL